MSTTLGTVEFELYTDEESIRRAAEEIQTAIGLAQSGNPALTTGPVREVRREPRHPFVTGASLMAVCLENGRAAPINPDEPLLPVITLNISPHGVSIQHEKPVPGRTYVLIFDLWTTDAVALLVKRRWSRQENAAARRQRSGFAILAVAREWQPQLAE